jgi:hypothetical protein
MGVVDNLRLRLAAALSPNQMTRQLSKPVPQKEKSWNVYKDDLDFEDYDKMLKDSQIKSGYELIRMFLQSRKMMVTPADDTPEAQEIAEELEKTLDGMDYPMRKVRNDLYSAIVYGFSVGEFVWSKEPDSEQISIKRIRPIPTFTLDDPFEYDEDGNLKTITQKDPDGGADIIIPAEKCLVYSYDEQWGDREGNSILEAVYDNWFMKQDILLWYQVYLQKHEGPTLAAFVENAAYKDEAQDMLEEVHEGRANISLGVNDRVEVIESAHRGEAFKEAINYHDTMIFRKMNIGTLILGQENGSGAYAQSKTQYDTLAVFLDGIHDDIATELQIKTNEWVDMHYNVEDYPKITFETFEDVDPLELLKGLEPLVKDMAINPNDNWFKQIIAAAVNKYTDVDMHEFLEGPEEQDEKQVVSEQQQVIPTPEEKATPMPDEHKEMVEQIAQTLPPAKGE